VAAAIAGVNMNPQDIVSHPDMCSREGRMLQHGMNFCPNLPHSVLLMSRRRGAPYDDIITDAGRTLIYEGHDVPRTRGIENPKGYDQPMRTPGGKLTPNGKFFEAAAQYKDGGREARLVRVYEKIREGIWTYNGEFKLVDAWPEKVGRRKVFKFRLELTNIESPTLPRTTDIDHNRLVPSAIKREVFKRDKGRCVLCGATDNLHFDHDFPLSKGGTSISAANIRLLCMRHNLAKYSKIE
jgi:hypothetical protein